MRRRAAPHGALRAQPLFFPQLSRLLETCRSLGAEVAEIRETLAKEAVVRIGADHLYQDGGSRKSDFYVGSGNDEAEDGTWVWASDGQRFFTYIGWNKDGSVSGQYHNFDVSNWNSVLRHADRNCMIMYGGTKGVWISDSCDYYQKVLCEGKALVAKPMSLDNIF